MSVAEARTWPALAALAVILVITVGWWALALWPVTAAPEWLLLTREVCFGTRETGLPNAGGWLVLMGQPLSMLLVLFAAWGDHVMAELRAAGRRFSGQIVLGSSAAILMAGAMGVVLRVQTANAEPFALSRTEAIAGGLTRLSDEAKPIELVNQLGDTVTLEQFKGRPVIVGFAYAHCETVCPVLVNDVLGARSQLAEQKPVVLLVTLDPWRDTPSRLPSIAKQWGVTGPDAHVLSGDPDHVERILNAWRIPRVRNEKTGDLSHPSMVYVVGTDGRIAYAVFSSQSVIRAAVEAL
ncbi:MAG TPA: SCO family protein [Gemmatimonadales bacterium]|nr:SCO family protein [Gemmatimonadales bacterium]